MEYNKRFKEYYDRWTNKIYSPASDIIHPEPRRCYTAGWEDCKKEVIKIIEDHTQRNLMSTYQTNQFTKMMGEIEKL